LICSVRGALAVGSSRLRDAGIENPRLEARLLLSHAVGRSQEVLLRDQGSLVETGEFGTLVTRRTAHEPLALILGHREFWGLDFAVSRATLIPRPDSETLIEAALAAFAGRAPPATMLDLGTGTGCLLLASLSEFPAAFGIGVDRSLAAAGLAAANAASLGMRARCAFVCADWTASLATRFDLILCNPPYIRRDDLAELMPDVVGFEPVSALDGGADGLTAYRQIIPDLPRLLTPAGVAILELGQGQAELVAGIAADGGFHTQCRRDLGGIPRALVLRSAVG
jgi:release factor glutamine methyltransferase